MNSQQRTMGQMTEPDSSQVVFFFHPYWLRKGKQRTLLHAGNDCPTPGFACEMRLGLVADIWRASYRVHLVIEKAQTCARMKLFNISCF